MLLSRFEREMKKPIAEKKALLNKKNVRFVLKDTRRVEFFDIFGDLSKTFYVM